MLATTLQCDVLFPVREEAALEIVQGAALWYDVPLSCLLSPYHRLLARSHRKKIRQLGSLNNWILKI